MERLIIWIAPIIALLSIAAAVWALLRLVAALKTASEQRKAIEITWQSYLENLSDRLKALRSLRAVLAQIHPSPDEAELLNLIDQLYKSVHDEIESVEATLDKMARADDQQWYREKADWSGGTDFHSEIQNLLILSRKHFESIDIDAIKDETRREVEAAFEAQAQELEVELKALQEQLEAVEALKAEETEPEEVEPEVVEVEVPSDAAELEQAIAARLMGELTDNDTLEDADAKISVAKGRINHAEQQALETDDPDEKEKLLAEAAWEKQCLRWWEHVHTIRRQRKLIDEATGKASEVEQLGLGLDVEGAQEFQEMELRAKEMRTRIASLTNENKSLSDQLEKFSAEQASASELRETLARVDMARRNAERELSTVEAMIEQLEDEVAMLRRKLQEARQKEDTSSSLKQELEQVANQAQDLEKENLKLVTEHNKEISALRDEVKDAEKEKARLEAELATVKQAMQSGNIEGMVPEQEMMELQQAYDKLNADLLKFKASAKNAENAEKDASEKLKKALHERDEILNKYKRLRDETSSEVEK